MLVPAHPHEQAPGVGRALRRGRRHRATADLPKPYRVVARLRAEAGPVLSSRAVTARLRERAGATEANDIAVRVGGAPQ